MLKKIFDMDNPLMQGLQTVAYLMILNILVFLLCIPLITAGAAFTALYDVLRDMVRHEETYPAHMFFDSFKRNLRQGIIMGLLFLIAIIVISFNYLSASIMIPPLRFLSLALAVIMLAVSAYAFPLLARFENSVRGTLKNAFLLMIGYFPRTLGICVFTILFYYLIVRFPTVCAPLVLMFGISLPCYVGAVILDSVLETLESGEAEL